MHLFNRNRRQEAAPAADNSRRELAEAREEIRKLHQALKKAQAELEIWYDDGVLLSGEDKLFFYERYQEVKQQRRERQVCIREHQAELEEYLAAYREGGENDDPVI